MALGRATIALTAAALCAVALAQAARAPVDRVAGPYGSGPARVWLVLPRTPPRDVVVFGHGWKLTPDAPGHPWVDQFRPWLDHLAAAGSAVIFPDYQSGTGGAGDGTPAAAYETALRTGFAHLDRPRLPVVAFGYSFGASLAFVYGANARAWRLPPPRAIQATFPAGPIAGAPLPPLDRSVRVLIQVGDADTEAGSGGANWFWRWLAGHPRRSYVVVRSTPQLPATHAAPKATNAAAQRAFWAPLDRLIAAVSIGRAPVRLLRDHTPTRRLR